jgi:two-component system sensor histidine kinase RegB
MSHLLLFRLIITTAQLLLLTVNQWFLSVYQPAPWLWLVCGGYLLVLLVLQWRTAERLRSRWLLVCDLGLWAVFLSQSGGVSSPIIWCLLLPSVLSALSQSMRFTWLLTVLANLVYGCLWRFNTEQPMAGHHGEMMAEHITGMWLGFIATSVILTWVTTALMHRIQQKNEALRALEKQQQADEALLRMATLATSLAHELGTPLASIRLLIDEVRQDTETSGIQQDLALMDTQVSRCKAVLERMTRLADTPSNDSGQWLEAGACIRQLCERTLNGRLPFELRQTMKQPILILVDDALELAISNVLNNSLSAGAGQLMIDLQVKGDQLKIQLSDDGAGQSYSNPQGLGMGLKLSSRIISNMGGSLNFQSDVGGAVTTIELPFKYG